MKPDTAEMVENVPYDALQIGQRARFTRRLTLGDLHLQLQPGEPLTEALSHEVHYQVVTQGMWAASLIATAVVTRLPGPGSRLLASELHYDGPVRIGDTVAVTLIVREKRADRQVLLHCVCEGPGGEQLVHGSLLVEAPQHPIRASREALARGEAGGRRRQMERLLDLAAGLDALPTAVVHPVDGYSLSGALEAARRGLIQPLLVGPEHKIRRIAENQGFSLEGIRIEDTEHSHAAAERAVSLARDGRVKALMKGALHTDEFMQPIVQRSSGLRTDRRMSHVWVMDVPTYPRPLCITDSALNIRPDLTAKADITQNAIELVQAMGVERPKVAILSATEEVNPQIQSTLDAAALCKMADRGQIRGGELDGPLAFDNAISELAAQTKGIRSTVAGRPDILLAPDLESANMLGKQLRYLADAESAGIVLGARVPVVLTSRADDLYSRVASCAIALLVAHRKPMKAHG